MPNSVNQTSGGLFSLVDKPVMKSLPPEPSESFDSAMKKAQPQPQPSDQQQSSQKTSQSNSGSEAKTTSKSTKGKHAHKKSDEVDKQDEQDEQDADQGNAVTAADAPGEDSSDGSKQKGGKKKDAQQLAAAGKASKADPLLQALATPTKTIAARDTSKDDAAANDTALKTPAQKKTTATASNAVAATKKGQAADEADDAEQSQDADDSVKSADEADADQQVAGKPAKSKAAGLGADDDASEPAYGAGPAAPKASTTQTDQLSAQQQQSADDAAMAAAATSAMPAASSSTPAPSSSGASSTSAVTSIDHLTALATDLTSANTVQTKSVSTTAAPTAKADAASVAAQAFTQPEVQFADSNHAKIVSGIQGQLMPNGGTMQIRLDPPELGALQVSIHMQNGVINATFETSNDDATKVLSHSLTQLKHALETQGVTVDKLHVQQAPRDHQTSSEDQQRNQSPSEQSQQKQEQQRRELLQRMWKRLKDGSDPLDMVA